MVLLQILSTTSLNLQSEITMSLGPPPNLMKPIVVTNLIGVILHRYVYLYMFGINPHLIENEKELETLLIEESSVQQGWRIFLVHNACEMIKTQQNFGYLFFGSLDSLVHH